MLSVLMLIILIVILLSAVKMSAMIPNIIIFECRGAILKASLCERNVCFHELDISEDKCSEIPPRGLDICGLNLKYDSSKWEILQWWVPH